ncbi:phosphotransferase-like protein [Oceanobacillus iheyensis]|nr:hypothetical protein [Oceanobacillus iheyensis]
MLNGVPRSGKSSVIKELQSLSKEIWVNLGVDQTAAMIDEKFSPGMGLRPGEEFPELEEKVKKLYIALFHSITCYSNQGLHVIVDVGFHTDYFMEFNPYEEMKKILKEENVHFFTIYCPPEVVMERRNRTWGQEWDGKQVPEYVYRWHHAVYKSNSSTHQFDTMCMSSKQIAKEILQIIN